MFLRRWNYIVFYREYALHYTKRTFGPAFSPVSIYYITVESNGDASIDGMNQFYNTVV